MGRRLGALAAPLLFLLLSRWTLAIGRPADDWRRVRPLLARPWMALCERVRAIWRFYGPVTAGMRQSWARLRQRHSDGLYGIEGT